MSARPLVSIFVQVYKTEPFLARCLDAVLDLAGRYDVEVLAIDDCSPDRSGDILASYAGRGLQTVRHAENRGANATANEGYAWARGKYVARIDSDDVYRPSFLAALLPLLERDPQVGLAYGDVALVDARDAITSPRANVRPASASLCGDEFFALCARNFIPAPATLVRREALLPLLPIPSAYSFLDWYLSTGIAERWHTAFCPQVVAEYRVHPGGAHVAMVSDGSGEAISFSVLDRLWSNGYRSAEKARARGHVYGANYLVHAQKYFGRGLRADARRCYERAFRCDPQLLMHQGALRQWAATFVPNAHYARLKRVLAGGR